MARNLVLPMVLALLALTGCTGTDSRSEANNTRNSGETGQAAGGSFDQIPEIVDKAKPSVVTIRLPQGGSGSGVVYKSNGIIVTNAHVVQGAQQVSVAFADARRAQGRVVAADRRTDLAVVKVNRDGLRAAEFQKKLPEVGELAVAIGSPLGFPGSVTSGVISGLHRHIPQSPTGRPLVNLIQTDAAISPGNSGGALLNENGQVVGINEVYIPPESGAVSIGFAIPSATVVNVVEQLLADGEAEHAFFGIRPRTVTPYIAEQVGLDGAYGVLVASVVEGSGAARAGIRPGSVIRRLNGNQVRTVEEFQGILRRQAPGDTVTVTLVGDGRQRQVEVTLTDRPSSKPSS